MRRWKSFGYDHHRKMWAKMAERLDDWWIYMVRRDLDKNILIIIMRRTYVWLYYICTHAHLYALTHIFQRYVMQAPTAARIAWCKKPNALGGIFKYFFSFFDVEIWSYVCVCAVRNSLIVWRLETSDDGLVASSKSNTK